MRSVFRKIICGTLSLCLLLSCVACGGNGSGQATESDVTLTVSDAVGTQDTAPDMTQTAPDGECLTVISREGASGFKVIRPDADDQNLEPANTLRKNLNTRFGCNIGIAIDWVRGLPEGEIYESDDYEILIGATNRRETAEALSQIGPEDYIVTAIGHKLVLAGHSAYATQKAIEAFWEKYVEPLSPGEALEVPYGDVLTGTAGADRVIVHSEADLRIMTLNINCSDNDAPSRYEPIFNLVMKYRPDIMCFQECNKAQYTNVINNLRGIYQVSCQYHKNGSTYVYTPILYLKDKYEVVAAGADWLDGRYTGTNTKSIAHAILKVKETGKVFGVINMHGAVCSASYTGFENKTDAERTVIARDWRLDNVRQMLALHDTLRGTWGNIPFFFTADYNFNCESAEYAKVMSGGLKDAEFAATVKRVTGTKTTHTVGKSPTAGQSIDHIFFDPAYAEVLVHFIGITGEDELRASDHVMVYADIKFQ